MLWFQWPIKTLLWLETSGPACRSFAQLINLANAKPTLQRRTVPIILRPVAFRDIFALLLLFLISTGCENIFYDEGARFANQVADFAERFRKSGDSTAVFDYSPKYGTNQRVSYGIGRMLWCRQVPCYNQGAATVIVEHGKSGTGYRIMTAACVPQSLQIEKKGVPVHVYMRKDNGEVQIVALR